MSSLVFFMDIKIVCRQLDMRKPSSKEAVEGKPGVGSKRDARSRRAEILRALGKSTTESDVTEGVCKFHSLTCGYCCCLLLCDSKCTQVILKDYGQDI